MRRPFRTASQRSTEPTVANHSYEQRNRLVFFPFFWQVVDKTDRWRYLLPSWAIQLETLALAFQYRECCSTRLTRRGNGSSLNGDFLVQHWFCCSLVRCRLKGGCYG
jgi:hypothetical protein